MKKQKRMAAGLLAAVLVTAAVGSAFAAGDKSDPLVTLSYLEQTVNPRHRPAGREGRRQQKDRPDGGV